MDYTDIEKVNISANEISEYKLEDMLRYMTLLETDVLTGLNNRYSYTEDIKALNESEKLPDDFVVFSVDINELKATNDTLGHLAGDEIIQGASDCIKTVLGDYGKCYRTGGDEFIAFLHLDSSRVYELRVRLMEAAGLWRGKLVQKLSFSIGTAAAVNYPEVSSCEKLIGIADEKMYEAKAQYYMQSGKNRRKNAEKRSEMIERQQKEYIDIISAFAGDVTGLYVLDRKKREVTAYRISASNHQIQSGVPLKLGFETAMDRFIDKNVHPDDRETMRQSIHQEFIERELLIKKSFIVHFRTVIDGRLTYNYMKCIRNRDDDAYDKIIISFCPEDSVAGRKRARESLTASAESSDIVLVAMQDEETFTEFAVMLESKYRCIHVKTGTQALELMKEQYSDIVSVFYQQSLPEMSAAEFLGRIKDDVFLSTVPVVVVIDDDRREDDFAVTECAELGAADFICRPYNKAVIFHRIKNSAKVRALYASIDEIETDDLTGLYTKTAFFYHASTLVNEYPNEDFTIIIADIVNFKLYNSIHGIKKGDELIKMLAKSVQNVVTNGIIARYGADQIIVIVKSPSKDISVYFNLVQENLNRMSTENIILKFGVYDKVDRNLEGVRMCDRALQALQSIKNNYDLMYASFNGPVSRQLLRAQYYESRFKEAIENGEFEMWYQPKYNPYTEKIIGAEALVRWRVEDGSYISPAEFLPVFENDGLISQLDEYVFKETCKYQRKRKNLQYPLFPISVNLSRNSMHHTDIVKHYKAIVEEYGIIPECVPIEITESAAIDTIEIKPLADEFYEAGFMLHMDDFGSGKSSIVGLNLLHFDTVKLDKSMIRFTDNDEGKLVLMYTVSLGKELGLHLVAEGVETKEQLDYLKDIGCEGVQGYYFCKPLPEEAFSEEVQRNFLAFTNTDKVFDYGYKLTAADSMVMRAMDRMLQRMPGGFFTYRRDDGRILSSNSYLWYIFGCETKDEFMTHVRGCFEGMVHPGDYDSVQSLIETQVSEGDREMDYVEYRIIRKDGAVVSVLDFGHIDHQPDGDVFYVFINIKQ